MEPIIILTGGVLIVVAAFIIGILALIKIAGKEKKNRKGK
jgi:hypothetical protein